MYKKHIVILSIDSPYNSYAGLGKSISCMVNNLPEYKFFCFGHGGEHKENNVECYCILEDLSANKEDNPFVDMGRIIQILNKNTEKIDAVHVFDWSYIPLGLCLQKYMGWKLVHTFALAASKQTEIVWNFLNRPRAFMEENRERVAMVNKCEREICDRADKIVQVSHHMASLFDSKYRSKTHVIHNGVDFDSYSKEVDKKKYIMPGSPTTKKVLYMGRFVAMKNVYNLFDAKVPDGVEIILAGGQLGSFPWLVDRMKNNPPKGFIYVGFISGEIKHYLLQNVDAVIVPSVHEPFGLVTLEAIASKTLLICSRASGMEEYILEDMCVNCGLTTETIELALERFLSMDDDEKQTIVETAYTKSRHLTWKKNATEYSAVYDSL